MPQSQSLDTFWENHSYWKYVFTQIMQEGCICMLKTVVQHRLILFLFGMFEGEKNEA